MPKFELMNEGAAKSNADEHFTRYNNLLHSNPNKLAAALSRLSINEALEEEHQDAAKIVNDLLDTTNNGTQIGLGPNTELAWDYVFRDEGHMAARHEHGNLQTKVNRLKYDILMAEQASGIAIQAGDEAKVAELRLILSEYRKLLGLQEAKLTQQCRMRGYQTLRVIASIRATEISARPRSTQRLAA